MPTRIHDIMTFVLNADSKTATIIIRAMIIAPMIGSHSLNFFMCIVSLLSMAYSLVDGIITQIYIIVNFYSKIIVI